MKGDYWKCGECSSIHKESEILRAANPFWPEITVTGRPSCKEINMFVKVCDEPYCKYEVTCGTSTPNGYRSVCSKHYRELNQNDPTK